MQPLYTLTYDGHVDPCGLLKKIRLGYVVQYTSILNAKQKAQLFVVCSIVRTAWFKRSENSKLYRLFVYY